MSAPESRREPASRAAALEIVARISQAKPPATGAITPLGGQLRRRPSNEFHTIVDAARLTARALSIDGVRWAVYELPYAPFDRRSGRTLVFETFDAVRRVRNYPSQWRDCSDSELIEISRRS